MKMLKKIKNHDFLFYVKKGMIIKQDSLISFVNVILYECKKKKRFSSPIHDKSLYAYDKSCY